MWSFTLKIIPCNAPLNIFQTHIPLQSNQFMMIKCTKFLNYFNWDMMIIFWMLIKISFKIDYWYFLPKTFIQYLLCFSINVKDQILGLQI